MKAKLQTINCLSTLLFVCALVFTLIPVRHAEGAISKWSYLTFQGTTMPDVRSATGWTSGENTYTTNGLTLDWVTESPSGNGVWKINNIDDVTGNGPFLDRYISITIDPASWGWGEWITTVRLAFSGHIQDMGEGFEIRSSMDSFQTPLVHLVGDTLNGVTTGSVANDNFPTGTIVNSFAWYADESNVYTTPSSLVQVENMPVEFRYYYWDTANTDGSGAMYNFIPDGGAIRGTTPYTLQMITTGTPVPIPGAAWLLASGLLGLVGFRRKLRRLQNAPLV
jgi:hypothetical protein